MPSSESSKALQTLFIDASLLVCDVGKFIREQRETFTTEKIEEKGFNDLVSYVDREAEERLKNKILDWTPNCGFINEESGVTLSDSEFTWIIDPLDGTTNFIYNIPVYSVSVALQINNQLAMGWVYDVNNDMLFTARSKQGAHCNNKAIYVSPEQQFARALVATGFPHQNFDIVPSYIKIMEELFSQTRGLRRLGSAALDLAYTASGRFNAFFEFDLKPWDVAAGGLILMEAGGAVTDFHNNSANFLNGTIVGGNPAIHSTLLSIIQKHV